MKQYPHQCSACFYEKHEQICRRYLDIKRKGVNGSNHPQLIIIMLNPVSCEGVGKITDECKTIPVEPDATLHKVLDFLSSKPYDFVRVLNLSDIKNADSKAFFKSLRSLKQKEKEWHSIFSDERKEEFASLVGRESKVLLAFGTNKASEELRTKAVDRCRDLGLKIVNEKAPNHYHPLMRKRDNKTWQDGLQSIGFV